MAFRRSLRQKFAYTFLGGALLTVVLFSVVIERIMSDYFAKEKQARLTFLQDEAGKEADDHVAVFKDRLQQLFDAQVAAVAPLCKSGLLGDQAPRTAQERTRIAALLRDIQTQAKLSIITLVGTDGKVMVRGTNPGVFGDDVFFHRYTDNPGPVSPIHDIVQDALAGKSIASYETFPPEILAKEVAFEGDHAVSSLADYVKIPLRPTANHKVKPGQFEERALMMTVVEPVRNSRNEIVGALIAGRSLNKDVSIVGDAQNLLHDQATIWISDGLSAETRIATTVTVTDGEYKGQADIGMMRDFPTGTGRDGNRNQRVNGETVVRAAPGMGALRGYYNVNVGRIALGRPLSLMDSIVQTQENIEKSVDKRATLSILGLAGLSMLIAAIIAWVFSKRITRRIDQLRQGAEIIEQANLDHRLQIDSGDEIELLASQFNSMASKLHDSYQTLERKVEERTRELKESQDAMVQQEKIAGIGQLAAGIAHEMNTPLGTIIGYAQMLREDLAAHPNPGGSLDDVDEIIGQAGRCRDLVKNLLNFSRRSTTEKSDADVNLIIRKILSLVEHDFELKRIHIDLDLSTNMPKAKVNENEIAQVILNLANNAADSMPGGGRLRVSTQYEESEDRIRIDVHDSGCGIPEADRNRVFEPFFTTKEVGKGTGLGLSICYKIIENHMGSMELDSVMGGGTTFRVYLPVNAEVHVA